ncbi:26153_t:CDS:1, partial [Racocetra persica]
MLPSELLVQIVSVGKREVEGDKGEEVGVETNLTPKQSKRTSLGDCAKVKLEMGLLEHFNSTKFD